MKIAPIQLVKKEIDDSHYYWLDGEFVPSVTAILEEAGPVGYALKKYFQDSTPEDIREKSKDSLKFGSLVHNTIERLLYGEEINLLAPEYNHTKLKKHLMSFHNWFHEFKPDVHSIQTELMVGSRKYKYAGTLDLACKRNGELWIIDFKTSAGIYPNYERQIAAYKEAYQEMFGVKVDHTAILRTGTQHKKKFEFKETEKPFDSFLDVFKTFLDEHEGKVPEPPDVSVYPDTLKLLEI